MKDSILKIPILPAELITEILLKFIISANNKDYTHHRLVLSSAESSYKLKDCSLSSLFNDFVTELFDLDYPTKNTHQSVWVVGSINGLTCLANRSTDLFLWNPSIRKFKKLHDPSIRTSGCHFDCHASVKYGFGYDESCDDYKVVVVMFYICRYVSLHPVKVKIYSLKSDYWRTVIGNYPGEMCSSDVGTFVNGKLHWASNNGCCLHRGWNIISIDLTDEKWGKLEQPRYGEGDTLLLLSVLRSDLSVCCSYMRSHTDVWVMKEYGVKESWTKMLTIKYPTVFGNNLFSPFLSPTLCMSKKGEILLMSGSTFMIHNPEDESIRNTEVANVSTSIAACIYIESLVCPYLQNEPSTQQE
ncbi:F-box/kelch-repeat protein At3g23880-like [Lycium barbarum]|uniref:F-box/kelch-repeat protein At3g23880-like n=1 Tax=Lycium barbarum TaxID=112863 RepID=UPI00293E523A|nr:F-box/kelch-repeat protein At3g23880-like [Lycium barbarum]